jgi:glucan 1,3-beta-glucosidase
MPVILYSSWITPSLFEPFVNATGDAVAVDEWTYTALLGRSEATRRLTKHWDTFLQQRDLQILAKAGITHVRIPVGYWLVSVESYEPFVSGPQWPYLLRALGWCKSLGLKVLIDLHGAPGSQNGFDNSGRRGDVHWNEPSYTNYFRTLAALANLTSMLAPYTQASGGPITGVELLNEPFFPVSLEFIQSYYLAGYPLVQNMATAGGKAGQLDVVIHDGFRLQNWANFMSPPQYQNVYLDTHVYHGQPLANTLN